MLQDIFQTSGVPVFYDKKIHGKMVAERLDCTTIKPLIEFFEDLLK